MAGAEAELDLTVSEGDEASKTGDGLLGILTVVGKDRRQVMTVARGILDELWIAGSLQTNERFIYELLSHPWVREGMFHSSFVDEEFLPEVRPSPIVLQVFASLCEWLANQEGLDHSAHRWAVGDQWAKPDPLLVQWTSEPKRFPQGVSGTIELPESRRARVCVFPLQPGKWQVRMGKWVISVRLIPKSLTERKGLKTHKLLSLVEGRVHSILYREGSLVPAHETAVIVESLHCLIPHGLPVNVRVIRWKVAAEDRVGAGQELADFGTDT